MSIQECMYDISTGELFDGPLQEFLEEQEVPCDLLLPQVLPQNNGFLERSSFEIIQFDPVKSPNSGNIALVKEIEKYDMTKHFG